MPCARYTAWQPGYYQTPCARLGTIWARVLHCAHGRQSDTVQPYRSVFPGLWSYWMEQWRQKVMPQQTNLGQAISKSEAGTLRGSHQVVQCRQPTDLLALCCKEACIHVDTWMYATLDTAIQLPWQWLTPSNNGATNSTGEEQTDLPCAPQDTSVQVQRQIKLFCHLHCAKSEEK